MIDIDPVGNHKMSDVVLGQKTPRHKPPDKNPLDKNPPDKTFFSEIL